MTRARSTTTDRTFRRKEPDSRALTSERIAHDLETFESSGGHIEVLGVTRVLKKLDPSLTASEEPPQPVRPRGGTSRG
jgi:hypothetical protein